MIEVPLSRSFRSMNKITMVVNSPYADFLKGMVGIVQNVIRFVGTFCCLFTGLVPVEEKTAVTYISPCVLPLVGPVLSKAIHLYLKGYILFLKFDDLI